MSHRFQTSRARPLGFTLLELLIAAAVLTVLVRLAYPSYKNYIVRTSREAAEAQLLQLANLQEKIYLGSTPGAYSTSVTGAYTGQSSGGLGSSGSTVDAKYTITLSVATANTFTLQAAPVSTSTQANDGNITVDQSGKRQWLPSSGTVSW